VKDWKPENRGNTSIRRKYKKRGGVSIYTLERRAGLIENIGGGKGRIVWLLRSHHTESQGKGNFLKGGGNRGEKPCRREKGTARSRGRGNLEKSEEKKSGSLQEKWPVITRR